MHRLRVGYLGAGLLLGAGGCSLITDFDRFQGEGGPCAGVVLGACEVGVPRDGICEAEPRPAGTGCAATPGSCVSPEGTCDGAGACVPTPRPAGTRCESDPGGCFGGTGSCNDAGTCIASPLPAGTACAVTDAVCTVPECDGAGTCGRGPVREDNDRCASAARLLPTTDPGEMRAVTAQCVEDDARAACGPAQGRDAFYSLDLPVPRTLRVNLLRGNSAALGVPAALSFANSCDRADEFACLGPMDLPLDATLIPGSYVLMADVAPAAGSEFPPEFQLRVLVDPQASCETPVVLDAPASGGEVGQDGSTLGANDDFVRPGAGTTPDHVYELRVARAGRFVIETFPVADDALAPGELNIEDSVLYVRSDACRNSAGTLIAENDDKDIDNGDLYSRIEIALDEGSYYVVVDGFDDVAVGSYVLGIFGS